VSQRSVAFVLLAALLILPTARTVAASQDPATWIDLMREGTSASRRAGREALIALGAAAVPALVEACADPSGTIRWEAVNALGAIARVDPEPTRTAIPALAIVALTDEDPHPRWRSLYALSCFPAPMMEEEALPLLSSGLEDPDPKSQWHATVALAYFRQPSVAPLLHAGLSADDNFSEWEAVFCLGFVHDMATVELLAQVLLDAEDRRVQLRQEAALTLGKIGDPAALPALAEALRDPEAGVRWRAALSLSRLGDPSVLPALRTAYGQESDPFAKEQIGKAIDALAPAEETSVTAPRYVSARRSPQSRRAA